MKKALLVFLLVVVASSVWASFTVQLANVPITGNPNTQIVGYILYYHVAPTGSAIWSCGSSTALPMGTCPNAYPVGSQYEWILGTYSVNSTYYQMSVYHIPCGLIGLDGQALVFDMTDMPALATSGSAGTFIDPYLSASSGTTPTVSTDITPLVWESHTMNITLFFILGGLLWVCGVATWQWFHL